MRKRESLANGAEEYKPKANWECKINDYDDDMLCEKNMYVFCMLGCVCVRLLWKRKLM